MSNLFGVELKSMRYDYTSPKTLYVHTIVIAGTSTKVLLTSFFTDCHFAFGSCYGGFGLVPSVNCKPKST